MLLQEHKREDSLRTKPHKTRHKPPIHPKQALLLRSLLDQCDDTHTLRCAHDPRLDHIHRTRNSRRNEASHNRSREMCREIILHARVLQEQALESVVTRQLTGRHQHSSSGVGQPALP